MKLQLKDKITVWEAKEERNAYGEVKYEPPKTIMGRWQESQEVIFSNFQETLISESTIYSNEKIKEESFVLLGDSIKEDPKTQENSYRVYKTETLNNLNNKLSIYKMLLCK